MRIILLILMASALFGQSEVITVRRRAVAAPSGFTHIQGKLTSAAHASPYTITALTSNPTPGNAVICGMYFSSTSFSAVSVHDSNSNAYTNSGSSPLTYSAGGYGMSAAYVLSAPSNATNSLTFTWTGGSTGSVIYCDEFHDGSGTATYDKDGTTTSHASGYTLNLPSVTPAVSGELFYNYACVLSGSISAPTASAVLGSWTGSAGAPFQYCMAEYNLSVSSALTPQYTDTLNNDYYATITVAIKP